MNSLSEVWMPKSVKYFRLSTLSRLSQTHPKSNSRKILNFTLKNAGTILTARVANHGAGFASSGRAVANHGAGFASSGRAGSQSRCRICFISTARVANHGAGFASSGRAGSQSRCRICFIWPRALPAKYYENTAQLLSFQRSYFRFWCESERDCRALS